MNKLRSQFQADAISAPGAGDGLDIAGHLRLAHALESVDLGIMMIGAAGRVEFHNRRALQLLQIPASEAAGLTVGGIVARTGGTEVFARDGGQSVTVSPAPGCHIDIEAHPLPGGGAIIMVGDVSAARLHEKAVLQAESEYRTLFDNTVYGIYRDTLDGRPIRVNPALAAMNGYASEADHIEAVRHSPGNWYVEQGRGEEFQRLLKRDRRVKDFVSEIVRHRTGEHLWITENAWYVHGADGNPVFIEGTIQDATERIANLSVIERQVNRDSLTGAASRFHFLNRLAEETRPERPGCVLYAVDVDAFKDVNDILGHGAGDAVLKTMVQRLQALAGPKSLVARIGGDEFAILAAGSHAHMEADILARRIVEAMRETITVSGHNINVGASVGVAVFPLHANDASELLGNADIALYRVKSAGRNGFRIFDYELKSRLQSRKELESDLRRAVEAGELDLFYQPIVDANSASVRAYEALMRWHHPRRGFLPPGLFIGVAEDAGLMTELGNWAIARACRQAVLLPGEIAVAVNVSPNQFRSADIIRAVRASLAETGLAPARLILEVTETVLLSSESIATAAFAQLHALGVKFALDDFGTGFSSLSYLQRFPFSKVKIDQSFVAGIATNPANLAIIRAVIGLGRDLAIDVVAEGVETAEQAEILRREGCGLIQGYFYGRPRPFAEIAADHAVANLTSFRQNGVPIKQTVQNSR